MTKRVLILGGAGFLGSQVAAVLTHEVGVELAYADVVTNPVVNTEYIQLNLLDPESLQRIGEFDVVVNCTGQVTSPFNLCYRLNTVGIRNLLGALSKTSTRVIQISTTAVYGSGDHFNESSPLNPETKYATAKATAEFLLSYELGESRLTTLRLSNLYGPGQQKGITAYLLRSFASDRKLQFNNNGNLIRSFLHVQDAANLIAHCALASDMSGIYNIKGPDLFSVKGLIEAFEREFNMSFNKEFAESDPWENIRDLDDSRIRSMMDVNFEHDIMGHFKQTVEGSKHG